MQILHAVRLADYSTMGLGGPAAHLVTVTDRDELAEAIDWAQSQDLPLIVIGSGSNIVWRDEGFAGLVIVNKIPGYETAQLDGDAVSVTVGAGENWDSVVERSVAAGLTGIEALSLIPGSAGATPVQNVGAYGQEIAQTLVSVDAYDTALGSFVTIPVADCGLGYRTSRFKTDDRGRFFIASLTLRLQSGNPAAPFYNTVQQYFSEHGVTDYTPAALRAAVIEVRRARLPDPAVVHNNGSFFANPIIDASELARLQTEFPDIPNWPAEAGRVKVSAAWLLEQAGFKDVHDTDTGMSTWHAQPLVLVNEHASSTADLLAFRSKILHTVKAKFGVALEQEPELLP